MPVEPTPGSVQTTDNLRIAVVPVASNALSAAIANGATARLLTYSLTPDGWAFPIVETEVPDKRLTLGQEGSVAGTTKFGPITIKFVYGTGADVARPFMVQGTTFKLLIRDSLANSVDFASGQTADQVTIICGRQRKDAATADGFQTISQTLFVVPGSYLPSQTLVA